MGSSESNIFTASHAEMALAFANHAAADLENARLFDAEQRRRLDAETLRQAASALSSSLDLETILNELLDALANVISYNSATVFIKEHESLRAMAAKGLAVPEDVIGRRFPSNDEVFGLILESRNPVILPDASADRHFKNWGNDKPTLGWMGVPLIARGEIIGCITFDSLTANTYTEADGNMAMTIASHAAIAIENSRLYNDALLAAERRAVLHEVSQEISRLGQDLEQAHIFQGRRRMAGERCHHFGMRLIKNIGLVAAHCQITYDLIAYEQGHAQPAANNDRSIPLMEARICPRVCQDNRPAFLEHISLHRVFQWE